MALERAFIGAFIGGGEHRILGTRLRPFCLWHQFLLQAVDSPLVSKGLVSWRDLQTAVGICSLAFPDSTIRRPFAFRWRGRLQKAVNAFLAYAGDHLYRPEYKIDVEDKKAPRMIGQAPDVLNEFADIFGWGTWPGGPADVWNLPIAVAHWYRPMALRARAIPISFATEHDRQFQADAIAWSLAQAAAAKATTAGKDGEAP